MTNLTRALSAYTPFGLAWRLCLVCGFVGCIPLFVCLAQAVCQEFQK
jgi:hypothetical protein